MPIEGTCKVCGSTTSDYNCLNCVLQECDKLKSKVERLEHIISEKPDFAPALAGEAGEKFQRFWEALCGLAEKADFKYIVQHVKTLEDQLREARLALAQKKELSGGGGS